MAPKTFLSGRPLFVTVLCACVLLITLVNFQSSSRESSNVADGLPWRHPLAVIVNYEDRGPPAPARVDSSTTRTVSVPHLAKSPAIGQTLNASCAPPVQRIVFLKTHKSGSTTMASVFERYGYYRNLTFVVGRGHVLSYQSKFSRKNAMPFPGMKGKPFDILTNHARYNRPEMDALVPDAVYMTIVRNPEDQVASAFGYFEMYRGMEIGEEPNPLKTFIDDPMKYYREHKYHMWQLSRNGMLFDLGFDHKYDTNDNKILEKIREIDRDFDLVLILEYLDESLILMKKLLCWEFEDILYLSCGVRSKSHRYEKDDTLRTKIRDWSHGDVLLYDHFKDVFRQKVEEYGPTFEADLKHFQELNKAVYDDCIDEKKMNHKDRREDILVLKNQSERCQGIIRADMPYTNMIRKSMVSRFGSLKT